MGAPTKQGLTAMEAKFVAAKVAGTVNPRVSVTDTECARLAGYSDPNGEAHEIIERPHVQKAIRDALPANIHADCSKALTDGLRQRDDQSERRKTVELIARLRGELSPEIVSAIQINSYGSSDSELVQEAASALSRFQDHAPTDEKECQRESVGAEPGEGGRESERFKNDS